MRGSFPAPHHHDPNENAAQFSNLGHGGLILSRLLNGQIALFALRREVETLSLKPHMRYYDSGSLGRVCASGVRQHRQWDVLHLIHQFLFRSWRHPSLSVMSSPISSLTLSGTLVFWSLRRIARCPRSWHSRNLRGGRERVIDGNTTKSPQRRDTVSGTGATFSRAAPQRLWQCRLDTGVPLATGRCEWRAASASKSAGLRRDVSDVPVATPQKSETARE